MENNIFSLENKNLLEILKPYDWRAKNRNILEENIREPNEKKGFNIEGFPIEEIFIRELAQNALDAVEEKGQKKPVILNLEIVNYINDYEKSLYRKFINPEIIKWLKLSKDIPKKDFRLTYKALKASDFNTSGLSGDVIDRFSNWHKYTMRTGTPDKSKRGDSLGSRNEGKVATWACSRLWMVFLRTQISEPNPEIRFIGKCLRRSNTPLDDPMFVRSCDEYFRKKDPSDVSIGEEFNKFLTKNIFKQQRDSDGTDFLFPEFDAFEISEVIPYAIKNWFTPIAEGKFELNINNISINKNNYLTLRKEYGAGINSENLDEEMMKFVIDSRNFDEKFLQISLKEDLTPTQYEQKEYTKDFLKTSDYSIKEISQKLTDGEHLIVKVPFKIQRKKGTIRDEFYIGLKMRANKSGRKSFGIMLRKYQILWKEKTFFEEAKWIKDLMVTVISKNPETNTLLTHFETSSHLLFNESGFSGDLDYDVTNAKLFLRLFRRSTNKIINLLFEDEEVESKNLLAGFFSIKSSNKRKNIRKTKEQDNHIDDEDELVVPKPITPIGPSKPRLFSMEQNFGKILLTSIKNQDIIGKKVKIEFGIKTRKGEDAFNKINKFDLDFENQSEISAYSGCEINNITSNSIEIEIESETFGLEIDNLTPSWSYKTRYTILN